MSDDDVDAALQPHWVRLDRIEEAIGYLGARVQLARAENSLLSSRERFNKGVHALDSAIAAELPYEALLAQNRKQREDIEVLKNTIAALEAKQRLDPLTHVYDRGGFEKALESEWMRAVRNRGSVALLFVDLDSFKSVNDTFGHPTGDALLQHVARIVDGQAKRAGETVARYGGDEFCVIVPQANAAEAADLAERIRVAVSDLVMVAPDRRKITTSVSVGVASVSPRLGEQPALLVDMADRAVLKAKDYGRNKVIVAQPGVNHLEFSEIHPRATKPRTATRGR